ncbi:MAG: methyltransferase domain-containing protein [Burkholderiales bacterium]|nr:methyltransferase domain-containing protein [Burkholderiales bacterium]
MNVQLLTSKLLRTLREDGVQTTCRRAMAHISRRRTAEEPADEFDRLHGTDTGGREPLWKLSIGSPNARFGERYEATTAEELTAALDFLSEDLRNFTFIDLGCGKGRTLLVASERGFKRVIGVEFARELADTAARNLERRQAVNAIVLHADAGDFDFPDDDLVLYMYNPFSEVVVHQMLSRLRASAAKKRYVIYKAPRCADVLDASGFLQRHGQPAAAPHMEVWRGHA